MGTIHERHINFDLLREKHVLPKALMAKMKDHYEFDIIMALTEIDPTKRPSAQRIKDKLIPKWAKNMRMIDEDED